MSAQEQMTIQAEVIACAGSAKTAVPHSALLIVCGGCPWLVQNFKGNPDALNAGLHSFACIVWQGTVKGWR